MILEYIRWLNYSYSQIIADYTCLDWPINCLKSTKLRWDWPSMKPGARDGVPPCPRASWLSPWSSSHCLEHLVPRYVSQGGRNHCRKSLTISYNFLQYLTVSHGFCTCEVQMQYSHGYVWKWRIPPFLAISMSKTWQKHDHRIFGHSTVLLQYTLTRCQGTRLRARSKSLEDSWEFIVLSSWWLGSVGICCVSVRLSGGTPASVSPVQAGSVISVCILISSRDTKNWVWQPWIKHGKKKKKSKNRFLFSPKSISWSFHRMHRFRPVSCGLFREVFDPFPVRAPGRTEDVVTWHRMCTETVYPQPSAMWFLSFCKHLTCGLKIWIRFDCFKEDRFWTQGPPTCLPIQMHSVHLDLGL